LDESRDKWDVIIDASGKSGVDRACWHEAWWGLPNKAEPLSVQEDAWDLRGEERFER